MPPAPTPFTALTHEDPAHVADYRLLARLGSGGMGTVYLARSAAGRTVALKTVHARITSSADTTFRTRFQLETDAARIIGDRYGARVFGADPLAATPWLATEYVLGPQLDHAVRLNGPLPELLVRSLGAHLAQALSQLHESAVVHRDLKPSNIMLTATGPKLIDFGIARALGDERLTSTGTAAGTPAYMSPEQASGLEHAPAGDVFALASVLVFAASGHGPFGGGQPADLLYRVRYADPDLTGVPASLHPVLTRCLSKDPSARPSTTELTSLLTPPTPSASTFPDLLPDPVLADIARRTTAVWQDPPPRLAAPETPPRQPASPAVSRRKLLALTGTAALATGGGGLWAWLSTRDRTDTADAKPSLAQPPSPLWQTSGGPPGPDAIPVRVGDELVLVSGSVVNSLDPETGKNRWQSKMDKSTWQVTIDGKTVYALRALAADDKDKALAIETLPQPSEKKQPPLLALASLDGAERLNQLLCVDGDTAYLIAKSTVGAQWFLLAVGLKSGRELWRREAAAPAKSSTRPGVTRGEIVKGGLLLCHGAPDSLTLSLHDPGTGAERWRRNDLSVQGLPPYRLATDDDHVYVAANTLQALRLTDGTTAWSFGAGRDMNKPYGFRRYGLPAVADGVVYAVEGALGIVAVDARTGTERWSETPLKDTTPNGDVAPVISAGLVFSMDKIGLRAVDLRTHRPRWRYPITASILTADPDGKRLYLREPYRTLALPTS
ncbi:PQQ-binding-like beta-propeller repeat protein [Streptomyces sp. NPDC085524]|uniref:protein kinase domain-containing protein n=1 Tax=Streptomyces sp. NPDC085524 TaxID=3365728 RepID=UPI0037D1DFA3